MSIEQNLERIAAEAEKTNTLLTALLNKFDHIGQATTTAAPDAPKQVPAPAVAGASTQATTAPVAEVPPSPPAQQATPAPTTTPPVNTPAAAATAPTPPAAMTPEELNYALVVEFQRLGGRDAIDAALREFGATTITDLPAEQYQSLLAKVQAIPA